MTDALGLWGDPRARLELADATDPANYVPDPPDLTGRPPAEGECWSCPKLCPPAACDFGCAVAADRFPVFMGGDPRSVLNWRTQA